MKVNPRRSAALLGAAFGLAAYALFAQSGGAAFRPSVEKTIAGWPLTARLAAGVMLQEYGEPDSISGERLSWNGKGPWKRTTVYRDGWRDESSHQRPEVLEQTIAYWVPRDRIRVLERFDERFTVDSPRHELSFRSDSERWNFLAMNLANEVVTGAKTVEEARAYSAKAKRLAQAGKRVPYTEFLIFQVSDGSSSYFRHK